MKSMTGFGAANISSEECDVDVSVKAVNGRYLEARFHLPFEYVPFESDFKRILGKWFQRGSVNVYVTRRPGPKAPGPKVIVQAQKAKQWIEGYKALGKELQLLADPNLDMVSRLPDVIKFQDELAVSTIEKKLVTSCVEKALRNCDEERLREGDSLEAELKRLLDALEGQVKVFSKLAPLAKKQARKTFEERLKKWNPIPPDADRQKLYQEIASFLDKGDITEEVVRLKEHCKAFRALLSGAKAEGKKLDFYTQELLRESNTIGSKAQYTQLTQAVVEAKSLIEKIREQVQNVE